MGTGKKEAARRERQGKGGDGLDNVKIKGENFYRYIVEVFQRLIDTEEADGDSLTAMRRRSKP